MPLRSIPPVHRVNRGLVNRGKGYPQVTSFRLEDATGFKTPLATPVRRQSPLLKAPFPSIQDVKVTKTPHKASWEFPNGEFAVMVEREEVHIEVKLGRFIDALLVKTDTQE